jgi:soluble lytic murein transglycosylase
MQARSEMQSISKSFSSKPLDEIWIDELPWSETSIYVKSILRNALMYQIMNQDRVVLSEIIWKNLSEIAPSANPEKEIDLTVPGL